MAKARLIPNTRPGPCSFPIGSRAERPGTWDPTASRPDDSWGAKSCTQAGLAVAGALLRGRKETLRARASPGLSGPARIEGEAASPEHVVPELALEILDRDPKRALESVTEHAAFSHAGEQAPDSVLAVSI